MVLEANLINASAPGLALTEEDDANVGRDRSTTVPEFLLGVAPPAVAVTALVVLLLVVTSIGRVALES